MTNEQKSLMVLNTMLQINAAMLSIMAGNAGLNSKVESHLDESLRVATLVAKELLAEVNGKA